MAHTDADDTKGTDRRWGGELLDLDAYLARIGHTGDRSPTPATLRALHRAHVTAIPFENLEIILGRPVPLDLPGLQRKIVHRARGGYCFEHARLFAAALERLGFGVTGLSSRVDTGSGRLLAATHAVLRVETAETAETGRAWLCDVGFGTSPLEPIELADGAGTTDSGWTFRLERHTVRLGTTLGTPLNTEQWTLRERRTDEDGNGDGDGWLDLHSFTLTPQYPVDWVVANHYVSTHPRSPFTQRAIVQRTGPDVRHALHGTTLVTTVRADGSRRPRELEPHEVPQVLEDVFGIVLDADDTAALATVLVAAPERPSGGIGPEN